MGGWNSANLDAMGSTKKRRVSKSSQTDSQTRNTACRAILERLSRQAQEQGLGPRLGFADDADVLIGGLSSAGMAFAPLPGSIIPIEAGGLVERAIREGDPETAALAAALGVSV